MTKKRGKDLQQAYDILREAADRARSDLGDVRADHPGSFYIGAAFARLDDALDRTEEEHEENE